MYINVQSLCYEALNRAQVHFVFSDYLEMALQLNWSPLVVNSVDFTLFKKPFACLYKVPQVTAHIRAQTKHEV